MTMTMQAITLWQPWASAVAEGVKTCETRDWAPPECVLGERVAIHAASRDVRASLEQIPRQTVEALRRAVGVHDLTRLPRGSVLATATLFDVVHVRRTCGRFAVGPGVVNGGADRMIAVDELGDFRVGRYLWLLRDVRRLSSPARAVGHQRLWAWTPGGGVAAELARESGGDADGSGGGGGGGGLFGA